jgi:hypothetical protein
MTSYRTGFVPSIHGFHFSNAFQNHVIDSGSFHFATEGRCGGMAMVALDYYYAHVPIPSISYVDQGLPIISGPAVCRWPDGNTHAFVLRFDGSTATKSSSNVTAHAGGSVWPDWEVLSRDAMNAEGSADPAVCSWGQGRIDLFTPGSDGVNRGIRHLWFDGGGWAGDPRPCGNLGYAETMPNTHGFSSLGAASPASGQIDLFATSNGRLQSSGYRGSWQPWVDRGTPPNLTVGSAPAAASQPDWANAVVRASDNSLWHVQARAGTFSAWQPMGGVGSSPPALATPYPERLEAYVVGTDGQMYIDIFENGAWGGWTSLGAPPAGLSQRRPAAVSAYGYMDVYVVAKDGMLWHKQWSGNQWNAWALADERPTGAANHLTGAILDRLMKSTIDPLVRAGAATAAAGPLGGIIGYAGLGSDQNNVTWWTLSGADCWTRSWTEQLQRITSWLSAGKPIPIGLIPTSGVVGHQVVATGIDIGVPSPNGTQLQTVLYIYDNEYPGCDSMTLVYDPNTQIISQPGVTNWKGVFARDDYAPQPPPTL